MDDEFFTETPQQRDLERLLEPDRLTALRRLPVQLAVAAALLTVIGMIALRPTGLERPNLAEVGINPDVFDATVVQVIETQCPATQIPCADVTFRLDAGPDVGTTFTRQYPVTPTSPEFAVGDGVVLDYQPDAEPDFRYNYYDKQRRGVLWLVAFLFAAAVVALGRLRGLAALVGLIASLIVLLQFVIPAILDGRSAVLVAVVGASAIAFVALYAAHGFTMMTTVALLGTLAALLLTAVLSVIFLAAADFTGFSSDESFIISLVGGRLDISGLILAGVILGSLGAIDDVTVTQASAVWEIKRAQPRMPRLQLFRAGLRVGRDHVASTVNTLLLAYAGAAMPLLLFFVLAGQSLGTVINTEIVATEVLRTLLGSIGLVSAVPLTTYLAALMADPDTGPAHTH